MKKILGLDLGTTSIGWAYVLEAENENEQSKIIDLGVRVNPLTTDEQQDFEKGKTISVNADRTLKRGARRNLQRYKLRRDALINLLVQNGFIEGINELTEGSTFETLAIRAKAAKSKIEKHELARVLLSINKKKGYKSSRKVNQEEEGQLIDGMEIAKYLNDHNITPGQYCYEQLKAGKKRLPDFYRSDLISEFERIWHHQKNYYPEILNADLFANLEGKNKNQTWAICQKPMELIGLKRKGKREDIRLENYKWRRAALEEKLDTEELAIALQEINGEIKNSSGYLGAISDRSKELYFNNITVGQYLFLQLKQNPHTSLKKQVFYRQDYLDEFDKIWKVQKSFHPELSEELRKHLRDLIVFYQRPLKSQKGLISFCEFESTIKEVEVDGKVKSKRIGARVCPKSSPFFQEFKIWQNLSHLTIRDKKNGQTLEVSPESKQILFDALNIKGDLKANQVLKLLGLKSSEYELNYTELHGNTTNRLLFEAYAKMMYHAGYELDLDTEAAEEIAEKITAVFNELGISKDVVRFDSTVNGLAAFRQPYYQLWHLLYSYEGDQSKTGNETLFKKLNEGFGFEKEYAQYLVNVQFQDDYGSLCTKALRKILPYLKENNYSEACALAGYNHSSSLNKEELAKRTLKDKLELLPKNSLRNPVVEKILNQMVNLVNAIIDDPVMGKPDEVRIELARELKKNAKERARMFTDVNKGKVENDKVRAVLQKDFGIKNPSRNDVIRYRLYEELKMNGYKTLYTNTYISKAQLFSKEIDIEHIIPKARLFDDSYSNKTLEFRTINQDKGEETPYDYISKTLGEDKLGEYMARVEKYYNDGHISKAKYLKLIKKGSEIGEGFIERDLRDSQYIAKKAKEMLFELCRSVVPTTGRITDRLREDWGLINVMKEINLPKYREMGLTYMEERKDGQKIEQIKDWTKRNDHRHHAMDALTVAFTKHNHIQYLNNLNARKSEGHKKHGNIIAIEQKETIRNTDGKRVFKQPVENFRQVAKQFLEGVYISHKAKNKVVTRNKNKVKGSQVVQLALTPRGQLHKETVYGKIKSYETAEVKIGASLSDAVIKQVSRKIYREALQSRLSEFGGDAKIAFTGKNSHAKNPVLTESGEILPDKVKIVKLVEGYTIRKDINPDNFQNQKQIDKIIDKGVKKAMIKRLGEFNGNAKEAFVNLEDNPIWLNKEKGISIKRATISGVSNAEPLHYKKDHNGKAILDGQGQVIPCDFVSTGNNHHVAIYKDQNGKLQERVVSFYEALGRVNAGLPIIINNPSQIWDMVLSKDEGYYPQYIVNALPDESWEFLFTMKQNEMFVFPSDDFNPCEIDLMDRKYADLISMHLFRVQKLATKNYVFNHHLETLAVNNDTLKNKSLASKTYHFIQTPEKLSGIVKVRINCLGHVVQVGELD